MLHKETVEPATLELIRKLQADPELIGFHLVEGTGLALIECTTATNVIRS